MKPVIYKPKIRIVHHKTLNGKKVSPWYSYSVVVRDWSEYFTIGTFYWKHLKLNGICWEQTITPLGNIIYQPK